MKYIGSDKEIVKILIDNCKAIGIKHVVIAPGSRNAPLILSFAAYPNFTCYSIPDERSAAFYALGMARQLNQPVAIICTSGTAVLNLAPAIAEAYYQEIPLIVLTADRPPELIDQEDGQTIRQHLIFANHCKDSITLPAEVNSLNQDNIKSDIIKTLNLALTYPKQPVHINIPFTEPLYKTAVCQTEKEVLATKIPIPQIKEPETEPFFQTLAQCETVVLLAGVGAKNQMLSNLINLLAKKTNIVVLAPATSNIKGNEVFTSVDLICQSINNTEAQSFSPDMLITLGGPMVSKAVKQFFRNNKPRYHFDIDVNPALVNTYNALTAKLVALPEQILSEMFKRNFTFSDSFKMLWKVRHNKVVTKLEDYVNYAGWSDLQVYDYIFQNISRPINLHLGNSTPVRYAELFPAHQNINYWCNRGTSGIDGCTSTTAGAAIVSKTPHLLITGDISFVYDSNAFWNRHIPDNLKIIVINNGGGNIFKIIPGPATSDYLDNFFVTRQYANIQKICEAFKINYLMVNSMKTLEQKFPEFMNDTFYCTVLEIKTPEDKSAQNFKDLIFKVANNGYE